MHRARVSTVAGKKALAEGKWLTSSETGASTAATGCGRTGAASTGMNPQAAVRLCSVKEGKAAFLYTLADGIASTNEENCDGCQNFHRSVTEGFFIWGRMPHIFCRIRIRETIDSSSMRIWMPTETFLRSRAFTGWRVI